MQDKALTKRIYASSRKPRMDSGSIDRL